MSEPDIIRATGLAAGYAKNPVWQNADFSIRRGDFVGVLGPNGAGKTTLVRLILGLLAPLSGTLSVFGEAPRRGNAKIGYVPQRHTVDRDIAIEAVEMVRLGACAGQWGIDLPGEAVRERAEALAALRDVGAEGLSKRSLGALSGGELQRIFLAEALSGNPELLLLDEPLTNLDIRRENEMVQLLQNLVKSRGVTTLLIAHNINPLLGVLDRVLYVANGRIATGSPEEVLTSASLSALYDAPVEVLRDSHGRLAIIGVEEAAPHHE